MTSAAPDIALLHRSTGKARLSRRAERRPAGASNDSSRSGSEGASTGPDSSRHAGKKKRRSTTVEQGGWFRPAQRRQSRRPFTH